MLANEGDTTPYTYFIKWSRLNKWYYGVRHAKGCHPNEFWVRYFTSSKQVKTLIEQQGDPDIIKVRKTFSCAETAILWEKNVLSRMNVLHRDDSLNMNIAGSIIIPKETYKQIAKKRKEKYSSYNGDVKGEKNPMFGRKWITNGIESRVVDSANRIPEGWRFGRTQGDNCISKRVFNADSQCSFKNTIWITNGVENKRINPDSKIPSGWRKGHSVKDKQSIQTSAGTIWVTNKLKNKKIKKGTEIPEGWEKGKTNSSPFKSGEN